MRTWIKVAAAVALGVVVIAGCTPEQPRPRVTAPRASDEPGGSGFDLDEVRDVLAGLPADSPFEWSSAAAVTYPANSQSTWADYSGGPEDCAVLYHAYYLTFADDTQVAPTDAIVTSTLTDKAGPGPDDDRYLARVSVRTLDESSRGPQAVAAVAEVLPACADGYVVFDRALEWYMADVTSVQPVADLSEVAPAVVSVGYAQRDSASFSPPQQLIALAAVGNVIVSVSYDIDSDVPESSLEEGEALARAVVEAFAAAG